MEHAEPDSHPALAAGPAAPRSIRPKRQEDVALLLKIAEALQESDLQALRGDLATHQGMVTLEAQDPVGFATYASFPESRVMEITWIAVRPDRQRRGVASAMCYMLESLLAKAGCRAVVVTVRPGPSAETARRFFLCRGYREVMADHVTGRTLLRLDLEPHPAQA